jgi:hypothetical protein
MTVSMLRLLAVTTVTLVGCGGSPPEEAVRQRLDDAITAVEARDTGYFRDLLSTSFVGARGIDREQAINRIRSLFLAYPRIKVVRGLQEVQLEGERAARASIQVGLVGDQGRPLAGFSADLYQFDLEFAQEADGEWRVIGADYSSALRP